VHVYRDAQLVVKWDLEREKPMQGTATNRLRKLIKRLSAEGVL
jgi:hypothetical protein